MTEELRFLLYQIVCMFQAWCKRLREGLELSPTSLRNCTVLLKDLRCPGAEEVAAGSLYINTELESKTPGVLSISFQSYHTRWWWWWFSQ